jgi:hypothetical protein
MIIYLLKKVNYFFNRLFLPHFLVYYLDFLGVKIKGEGKLFFIEKV